MDSRSNSNLGLAGVIARRPFLSAATFFILGIFAHNQVPARPPVYLGLGVALLLLLTLSRWWAWMADAMLAGCLVLAGLSAGQIEAFFYPRGHVWGFTATESRLAHLEMRVSQPPRILTQAHPALRVLRARQVMQAEVLRVLTRTGWERATGVITVSLADPVAELAVGQRVTALGLLSRPAPAANPGEFDWAGYYREHRILGSLHIRSARALQIADGEGEGPKWWLRRVVREALEAGFAPSQSLDHALLRALLVGDSDPQLRDVQDEFVRTGTSHHLAISGMHIAILGALVLGFCRLLLLRPRAAIVVSLAFVVLYGVVALPSPPVVRSVLLCVAYAIGVLSRRSVDGVQLLALSVFAMLVYQPLDIYNAGFQLSFGTVLGLMLFARRATAYFTTAGVHERVAGAIRQPTLMETARLSIRRRVVEAGVVGIVAWLVSAPLIAYHFSQLNPYAIPGSLVLGIPVFLALVGGFLKVILTLLVPPFAPYLAELAAMPIWAMRGVVGLLAKLPHSGMPWTQPPIWSIALFYALLALPLLPLPGLGRAGRILRFGPLLAVMLMMLAPWLARSAADSGGELRVALLSVGTGQCAVVELPSGKVILIDAGSSSYSDVYRRVLSPYLRSVGVSRVDSMFISHANIDHFSAAGDAVVACGISRVYVSPLFETHAGTTSPAAELLRSLAAWKTLVQVISAGQKLILDEATELDVLWPPSDHMLTANDSSLVLRLRCYGRSILFPGDIESVAEQELLMKPSLLRSDALVAPHHGSSEPSTLRFLSAVDPRIILSSNGKSLTSKQERLDALAAPLRVYRTDRCGAISLRVRADGAMHMNTFLGGASTTIR